MRTLIIEKTDTTPLIMLDPVKEVYKISGQSRPSDVREFYNQIISWLDEFTVHLEKSRDYGKPIVFTFELDYFNSSSAKLIVDICKIMAGLKNKGYKVIINWLYEEEDSDMLDTGKEISQIVNCPFEYIETS